VCGTLTPDDVFYEAAQHHINMLPQGKLYAVSVGLCESLGNVVQELRTRKGHDHELLLQAGSWPSDFGATPWFALFPRPIPVVGLDGNGNAPLVALAWSPPEEFVFIGPNGDTGFLQWPHGESATDVVKRGSASAALAPWILAATIYRSCWLSGGFDLEHITDPKYLPKDCPAGGFYVMTGSEDVPLFIDASTQARWN
jgi:hypothetical protein